MFKSIVVLLFLFHGLIHLLGFLKAFNLAPVAQLTQPVSRFSGSLWLLATLVFIAAAILLVLEKNNWGMLALGAVMLSQILIFTSWQDAKFGSIANLLALLVIPFFGKYHFEKIFEREVAACMANEPVTALPPVSEIDLQALPLPVQRYLRYCGVVGKPRVSHFKVAFKGDIRKNEQSEWMPFTSVQYNFMEPATRLFFMKATMKGLPVAGFHCYQNGDAFMDIRLLSLLRVQYQSGKEMGIAETVTFFNDMCCMAPATLLDRRVIWMETDGNRVKARFTNNGIAISAWLTFNATGELVDFVSEDRYAAGDNHTMQQLPWSTPLKDYQDQHGVRLAGYADAIYQYPAGPLVYGRFWTQSVVYNEQ